MTRRFARLWIAATLGFAAVTAFLNLWLAGTEPEPDAGGPPPGAVVAASVVGEAEVRAGEGAWAPLRPGRSLERGDEVRTGDFSEVVLRAGNAPGLATLVLTPNTTFRVGEDTTGLSSFVLGDGRLSAEIRQRRDRSYEFGAAGGDARARVRDADFSLVADGEGLLGVVTRRGAVSLTAQGHTVQVEAGRQAVALPGAPPGDPLPIPDEVFLQVKWPEAPVDAPRVALAGRTDTGARVRVDGRLVPVAPDGAFEVEVPVQSDGSELVVTAEDPAGNTRRLVGPVPARAAPRPGLKVRTDGSIWE